MNENDAITTKTIRLGKKKVQIKPHIFFKESMAIASICLQSFNQRESDFVSIISTRIIYGLLVSTACTNFSFDGIKVTYENGNIGFNINLNNRLIDEFEQSGIERILQREVDNYEEVYSRIIKSIELQNIYNALDLLAKNTFNGNKLEKDITETLLKMQDIAKGKPDELSQAIGDSLLKAVDKNKKNKSNKNIDEKLDTPTKTKKTNTKKK